MAKRVKVLATQKPNPRVLSLETIEYVAWQKQERPCLNKMEGKTQLLKDSS